MTIAEEIWMPLDTEESMAHSSRLLETICLEERIEPQQVSVHADNGGPMKGTTMRATM